jgi:hypothetical protein
MAIPGDPPPKKPRPGLPAGASIVENSPEIW